MEGAKRGTMELEDLALAWSIDDILNEELYSDQVQMIPDTFLSIEHHLDSYVAPLVEETRAELCSCLDAISEAPYSEIQVIERAETSEHVYHMDVGFWNNSFDGGNETYYARVGDFFILSSMKPEAVRDLGRYDVNYCTAFVTEVAKDTEFQKGFKLNVSKDIKNIDDHVGTYKYAIFLANIMTYIRIWRALHFKPGLNHNFDMIRKILSPKPMDDAKCKACSSGQSECWLSKFKEKEVSMSLNESQVDAFRAAILAAQCKHSNFVKLIWGPPGTGKTKTVSGILWALSQMKCKTLICAPTNVAVVGSCSRLLHVFKSFQEYGKLSDLPCSLGDVVLFGNKDQMEIDDELCDVFLDYRVDLLADCFSPSFGWKHRISSVIGFLEECASQHEMFLETSTSKEVNTSFLEFFRKRFHAVMLPLVNCIRNLWVHLPTKCISSKNDARDLLYLLSLFESFNSLLLEEHLTDEKLKEVFLYKNSEDECLAALEEARRECLHLLRILKSNLNLPHSSEKKWIRSFCLRNASLIFCTASSSFLLHSVGMDPLDLVVIDEAAQLKECESLIPLRLDTIKHVILVGDQCQLSSTVKSKICQKHGFGTSLFERLGSLGYQKHPLNMQYRMLPSISSFPNHKFYRNQILDGPNVRDCNYGKHCADLIYGPYAFINIAEGKEEIGDMRTSHKNRVEVAVILQLVRDLFKSWDSSGQKLSIGVVCPYTSQVNAIKEKLGCKYDMCAGFSIRVKTIDGFQGEEDDVIILSTVRSNTKGEIGFLDDIHRMNVALTRARYKLLVLGNSTTLVKSGSMWKELVLDAKERLCFFNASDYQHLKTKILRVKQKLGQIEDLLNSESIVLNTARWKVLFSDDFRKSFTKLISVEVKKEVMHMLLKLANGCRPKRNGLGLTDSFQIAKVSRIREVYLVWSVDVVKKGRYIQVIRVWDLLQMGQIARLMKRLDNIFSTYTEVYINHCKEVCVEGKLEVPISWEIGQDIIRYKNICKLGLEEDGEPELLDTTSIMENSKVSDSLLLMKFYSLTSGIVRHLLTSSEGTEMDIPFELTDQEEEIIRFRGSAFILGRSGTGKTTVLTMKLIQKEQLHSIASEGFHTEEVCPAEAYLKNDGTNEDLNLGKGDFLKQVFITVSPKLCSAIRSHIRHLKSFITGGAYFGDQHSTEMHDFNENIIGFDDIPDTFHDLPQKHYPLVITFRKFLTMLHGTMSNSFFNSFYSESSLPSVEKGISRSVAVQAWIRQKEVNYDVFVGSYWPHFNAQLTKKLDASTVFTQIISHIKGGMEADKLGREQYIGLSDKRVSNLSREIREGIYDIYLDYESKKCQRREFDLSDFVMNIHHRLSSDGYNGDKLDFVYVDEVQDLTMRQILLLKYVCKNFQEGFTFAGDTAQTIARGIDFRFEDIRSLFYSQFLPELTGEINDESKLKRRKHVADKFQLIQNFRTHSGVLKLAQSIMDLLYYYFPSCVDRLNPETSLVYGEPPILLESSSDDNAIITIFRNAGGIGNSLIGFGAEQVILVRDDHAKKQVLDLVQKQAIVLTIVECKGLEFQDVLLYNFFGESPLKNQWRVLYQYMKDKDILDSSVLRPFRNFDQLKHNLLCSELKQLYVAITRTRQRLWICENTDVYCGPMFDYWKRLCLVQVRYLDSSVAQTMQTASAPEEWKLRGIKLFNEENFEMAALCFERAGDEYREKWARAASLVVSADHIISTNSEMGELALKKAAEIYESIGKSETAATCYIKLKDFRTAGQIYLDKCGTSRLQAAGDCFKMSEWRSVAADVEAAKILRTKNVAAEVEILSDRMKSLSDLSKYLVEASNYQNVSLEFLSLRTVLNAHLHSEPSSYIWEPELVSDPMEHAIKMMDRNIVSVETLMLVWKLWKALVWNVLSYLSLVEISGGHELLKYEDFCLQYLGIRKEDNGNKYVLLNPEASWIGTNHKIYLQQDENLVWMTSNHYMTCAQSYWRQELVSVGMKVLEVLESLHEFSLSSPSKVFYPFAKGRVIISIYEVAKFLKDSGVLPSKSAQKIRKFFTLAEQSFFELVFPLNWRIGTTESMLSLQENKIAEELLGLSISQNINAKNRKLTHGQIGRTVMLIFLTGKFDKNMFDKLKINVSYIPQWIEFFHKLKAFIDFRSEKITVVEKLHAALPRTYLDNWKNKPDYISLHCYLYLLDCLMFLTTSSTHGPREYFFSTKSTLFEMLKCHGCKGYMETCFESASDSGIHFQTNVIKIIRLNLEAFIQNRNDLRDWIMKSPTPNSDYLDLITKLVITLILAHLNEGSNPSQFMKGLAKNPVVQDLPLNFRERLQHAVSLKKGEKNQFLRMLSDAMAAVENPLVIVCSQEICSVFSSLNAFVFGPEEIKCRENVIAKLFPENSITIHHEELVKDSHNPTSVSNSLAKKNQELASEIREDDLDMEKFFRQLREKLEGFTWQNKDPVDALISFLDSSIASSDDSTPQDYLDVIKSRNEELKKFVDKRKNLAETTPSMNEELQSILQSLQQTFWSHIDSNLPKQVEVAQTSNQNENKAKEGRKSRKKGKAKGNCKRK